MPERINDSLEREGGVVAHTQMFQNAFRNVTRERPPRPRLFGTGPFFDGAATPPLQGGEYARLNSGLVSIFLLQVTSEKCPNVSERPFPSLHHRKEGWPSDQSNVAQHPVIARPGWFSDGYKKENHPGCVGFGGFAKFF